ncbi:MAG: hypothetical protein WC054_00445 [Candidatus Nanopelagicales bacterium]
MAVKTLDDILQAAYAEEELDYESVIGDKGFIPTGNLALDFVLGGGIARGRIAELYGLSQSGKALALDGLVLTPTGYVRMGDLQVGDAVIDPEGQPSEVTGVFPQGEMDIYRLTFSDGSTCESTADHLWPFRYRVSRRVQEGGRSSKRRGVRRERQIFVEHKVVPLSEMMVPSRLNSSTCRPVLDAELRPDLDFAEGPLPLDPYLLGLLLGDGGMGGVALFTSADSELIDAVSQTLPAGVELYEASRAGRGVSYRLSCGSRGGSVNPLTASLRELGVMGHKADTKFVPESYKIASAKTRLAVLQGLLDTDAEACAGGGAAIFGSASRQLRDDVVWLARSLGCRVTLGQRQPKGVRVSGGEYFPCYTARITSRTSPLFRLARKAECWARRSQTGERPGWVDGMRPRVLVSVEFSRRAEAQCISVSALSKLFVTDDFIPTHNTTTAAQCAAECMKMGLPVLYVDFEQALDKPYLRALGVDVDNRDLFKPYPAASLEQGMSVASQAIRTGQLGLAIFDSVAAMAPRKLVEEDGESRTTAMERARLLQNELSKMISFLAKTGTAAIFINHERDVIETGPTRPGMPKRTTTPGGSGLKFYSSQRVQFKIVKQFKGERVDPLSGEKINETHSVMSQALVTKNKVGKPMQAAQLYLVLGQGFSDAHAAMRVLEASKIVRKSGAFWYFPDDLYHPQMKSSEKGPQLQGLGNVLDLADFDPEWGAKLSARARAELSMDIADLQPKLVDDPEGDGHAPEVAEEPVDPEDVPVTAPLPKPAPMPQVELSGPPPVPMPTVSTPPDAPQPVAMPTVPTSAVKQRQGGPDLSGARRLV